jgi:hypothetical protein
MKSRTEHLPKISKRLLIDWAEPVYWMDGMAAMFNPIYIHPETLAQCYTVEVNGEGE